MAPLFGFLVLLVAPLCCLPPSVLCAATIPAVQETIDPCSSVAGSVTNADSYLAAVSNNLTHCPSASWRPNGTNAFRLWSYSSTTDVRYPLVIVARQEGAVVSWTVPFKPQGFLSPFNEVNRTLCPIFLPAASASDDDVYVDIFTSSPSSVPFNISIEPVPNYELRLEETQSVTIGAATPQIHYFKFPNGIDTVTIEAESSSQRCAVISVQNNSCPANDLLKNARFKGLFQTMSTTGFLTVKTGQVENRTFLVVMITTNYSVCHSGTFAQLQPLNPVNSSIYPVFGSDPAFQQTINVTVRRLKPASNYVAAMFAPPLIFIGVYIVVLSMIGGCPYIPLSRWLWSPVCKWTKPGSGQEEEAADQPEEQASLLRQHPPPSPYGSTASADSVRADGTIPTTPPATPQAVINTDSTVEDSTAYLEEAEDKLILSQMVRSDKDLKTLESQYAVYSWNTITVGIFYGLPAFQLVLAQQLLVNSSGNQDQCYYNFKCAHPVGVLSAFNNIWSNIGYIMLGVLFLIIVLIRERSYKKLGKDRTDAHGVLQFFGMYYAMGIALILEGFMSSFYHICPSNANFQFDTAFMFIIGGLLLVKIFQNRHPTIHANAFVAFFSFAVVIFFTLLGIYFDKRDKVAIRVTLFFLAMILVVLFMVSFYQLHHWKCRCETLTKIFDNIKFYFTHSPRKWTFKHKVRLLKVVLGFAVNLFMAIFGMIVLNIPTAILALFLVNVLYFLTFYVIQKLCYKEPWTILPLALPLFIGILWILSFAFYFTNVSDWQVTPAESRLNNRKCILFDFYDNHDVWHLLSACAIFTSFVFILTLDDGLANVRRDKIHVF